MKDVVQPDREGTMARGRMINNAIAGDIKIHALSDDSSRLAFTWLITFADRKGRTLGDPQMLHPTPKAL
jgi:hypothetical protein